MAYNHLIQRLNFKINNMRMTKIKLEELTIRTNQLAELRDLLTAVIPDEAYNAFNNENQKMISILGAEERLIIKKQMLYLINKYFI